MEAEICSFRMVNVILTTKWNRVQRERAVCGVRTSFCVSAKFELHGPGREDMTTVVQLLRRQGFSLTLLREEKCFVVRLLVRVDGKSSGLR